MTDADKLNPGSPEAISAGCKCPVLDNAHGSGYKGGAKDKDGETIFIYSSLCKIHDPDGPERIAPFVVTVEDEKSHDNA